ncbi:MAG: TIGR02281 family clan AA aspartic protease [Proteobacteria bacterium]|nr:TIGR02281 family clan AA aspartic protease [Pseudomonadota bacterium]
MQQPSGPWQSRRPQVPEPPNRNRVIVFVVTLVAIGVLVWFLFREFPGALQTQADMAWTAYLAVFAALIASGFVASRRISGTQALTNIAMWLGIVVLLGGAYMMKESDVFRRVQGMLMPGTAVETASHELTINADDNGEFVVFGKVNGATVRFAVDTGASDVVLSPDDARRAGIDISALTYSGRYESANGIGHGAFVTLDTLAIGPIRYVQVPASVTRRNMHGSLLGMAFLRRLKSFEFAGNKLILRW